MKQANLIPTDNPTIFKTRIEGVLIIKRQVFEDERGFFRETYRKNELEKFINRGFNPVQHNHSRSIKGTLRGIHVAPWSKLVTVLRGEVQQVVVDLRKESSTFMQYFSVELGEGSWQSVFIPPNCGNAFLCLSEISDYMYMVDDYWTLGKEIGIIYKDPELNIAWRIDQPILSKKDMENPTVKEIFNL